ncbi:SAP domain-containing protein [Rhodococcus pyridinivorans]|uniref:SAP domain-containing protein n=1 Tax=Rhodococcus pyridinivorans TaxID=103816 RepID=UPI001FFEC8BB|nr:SAP domain-containing protein [Rhodococcus pyridinivorans]UPK63353.1 SAP domain-containing protein [Rhodococcus pyridinivorans]
MADLARKLDIRVSGSKELLTRRIAAKLGGIPFAEPQPAKRASRAQLAGPLTSATAIPEGQRCSQVVRTWFTRSLSGNARSGHEVHRQTIRIQPIHPRMA